MPKQKLNTVAVGNIAQERAAYAEGFVPAKSVQYGDVVVTDANQRCATCGAWWETCLVFRQGVARCTQCGTPWPS